MFTLNNFYKSKEWQCLLQQLKLERVKEDGVLYCEHCGKLMTKAYDIIGHHKEELTEANVNNLEISLNPNNISLIHFKCHNKIHERFGFLQQKVYIVYGSPCSGKTTWVNNVANKDDLILDIDNIWECICNSDKYNKTNRLKANVFNIRDCIIDQIKTRTGMWRNAFVIGGYPLMMDRERLADKLGAELIYIDSTKEECLERSKTEKWKEYIEEWFELYTA